MTPPTVLVADDDRSIRTVLTQALGRSGYQVRSTGNAATLWRWVEDGEGDLVITDVVMPDENGLDLIPRIRKIRPDLRVVVMSAQSTLMTAVKATQRGAFEYLPKPFDLQELLSVVGRALAVPAAAERQRAGAARRRRTPAADRPQPGDAGDLPDHRAAHDRRPDGDDQRRVGHRQGAGGARAARLRQAPGGPVRCHQHGGDPARTDRERAVRPRARRLHRRHQRARQGRFEQANGGTLFLDEIGDMPPEAQTRLLRVLQEGEFTSVGGRQPIKANVRIIAATHRDLRKAIRQGQFREDLFYRLNVVPIRLPPLRERVEDIPLLARHFLERARDDGLPAKTLDQGAVDRLQALRLAGQCARAGEPDAPAGRALPGRDDRRRADRRRTGGDRRRRRPRRRSRAGPEPLVRAVERHIREFLAAQHDGGVAPSDIYDRVIAEVERPLIRLTLAATRGNQIKAAAMLGLNRNTLRKKIRDLEIPVVRGLM